MAKFVVQWNYHSGLCDQYDTGVMKKGATLDLTPEAAAEFNADSPGVLKPAKAEKKEAARAQTDPPKTRAVSSPPKTRSK